MCVCSIATAISPLTRVLVGGRMRVIATWCRKMNSSKRTSGRTTSKHHKTLPFTVAGRFVGDVYATVLPSVATAAAVSDAAGMGFLVCSAIVEM